MEAGIVFFVGKPGCGKGTQAKLLAAKTGWSVVSAGKQFREMGTRETPVGKKVKSENDAGLLQPHWLAMYLYLEALFKIEADKSAIFDGFNRKVPEAELIRDSLVWLERPFKVFNLAVSDEVVRARLAVRKDEEQRADDLVVEQRLKEYYANTEAALDIFRNAGHLVELNGEDAPEKIAADINQALNLA